MGSLNKVMLIGNLGNDPDYKQVGGRPLAKFRLATNRTWKDHSGGVKKDTEWHNVVVWGKLADTCGRYLSKGKQVYIEGRLQTRKWTDKDGHDRYTTEVVASSMVMLGRKDEAGEVQEWGMTPPDAQPGPDDQGSPPEGEEPPF